MTEIDTETEAGQPNEVWKVAKVVGTEEEAVLVAGFLHANGFAAQIESLHASEFPATVGELGEIRIEVREDQLAEAQRLLAAQETETETA
jgi:hypothetical protein